LLQAAAAKSRIIIRVFFFIFWADIDFLKSVAP
jgi:hypothetical protein